MLFMVRYYDRFSNIIIYLIIYTFFSTGIILVYDLTNLKSSENLHKWLAEILNKDNNSKYKCTDGFDMEQLVGSNRVINKFY